MMNLVPCRVAAVLATIVLTTPAPILAKASPGNEILRAAGGGAPAERPVSSGNRLDAAAENKSASAPHAICGDDLAARGSEVCAAWQSADAASDAARWAYWQMIL